jgi:hypothetical protein
LVADSHAWVSKSGRPWSLRVRSDLCAQCGRTPDAHPEEEPRIAVEVEEAWRAWRSGRHWAEPIPQCRTELQDEHFRHRIFREGWFAAQEQPEIDTLRNEVAELRATFDLRWKADMRAIKMWQEAHPGKELVWPDHADLVVWLMEQLNG